MNRQEKVVMSVIERVLDDEMAEHQEKLDEQINKMKKMLKRSKSEYLSDEETKEIKSIKESYPYNLKEILDDEERMSSQKEELKDTISKLYEMIENYKERIKEMMSV